VWECARGVVRPPPRERVSRAAAEGHREECVCEAESELESVYIYYPCRISSTDIMATLSMLCHLLYPKTDAECVCV